MNASEFAYLYRRGYYGPTFGADPVWSEAEKESVRQTLQQIQKPFSLAGKKISSLLKMPPRTPMQPKRPAMTEDQALEKIQFQNPYEEVKFGLEEVDDEVSLMEESFGFEPISTAIIGLASAAPAIALALKGKKKRLEALQKKVDKLEAKLSTASGKKEARLQKKIDRLNARIDKLKGKLGIPIDEEESDLEKEKMGLYSTHSFLPMELEDHSEDPGILGVRRPGSFGADWTTDRSVANLSAQWLGKSGVVGVGSAQWSSGPVITVYTENGLRPSGLPGFFEGYKVVVLPKSGDGLRQLGTGIRQMVSPGDRYGSIGDAVISEMFGHLPALPSDDQLYELGSSPAATADEGTIVPFPLTSEPVLSEDANDSVFDGVNDFLSSRGSVR